jgi:hypothetical protein
MLHMLHPINRVCLYMGVQLKSKLNTPEPDWPQHDHFASFVITQHYSSITLVLMCFHSAKE